MSHHANYNKATNSAYEYLSRCPVLSLATNVFYIIENLLPNCRLLSYGQACFFYAYSFNDLMEVSEYGFSILCNSHRIILYNENAPFGCIRFTLAHEIGHAVLGHQDEDDPISEKEANCFARNLLCPVPIVYGLNLCSVNDYTNVFAITDKMASVSIDYMHRDRYYITKDNWATISEMLDAYMFGFESVEEYKRFMAS